ncbi:MAG: helix-turn-helix domain-containing protein [Bacillota bacterium]|nr:helix-turn-helix domain-containing protein [Bacillota bacterium]
MLLKADEAAKRLGVTAQQLRTMARSGSIPSVRCGTRYMFSEALIARLLARRSDSAVCLWP